MKSALIALAKLAVSVALIAVVMQAFDLRGVAEHLARVDPAGAALAVVTTLVILPLQTLRWDVVMREDGNVLPFKRVFSIVWIGQFFNQTLPSSVGGDALRMWYAYRAGMSAGAAISTVVVDRLVSLLGVLVIAVAGLPWLLPLVTEPAARSGILLAVGGGMAAFVAVVVLAGFPRLLPDWRIVRTLLVPAVLLRRVLLSPRRLLPALAVSAAGSALFCVIVYQLGQALGARLGLVECLLLVPLVMLVSALPISVAGWGLREGAMVVALGYAGIAPAQAFAISVLFGLTVAVASLPGVALWFASGDAAGSFGQAARMARGSESK